MSAVAVVAEVDLAQGSGGDLAQLVLGGAGLLGLEEPCGVARPTTAPLAAAPKARFTSMPTK
ncbi:hypothetical protein ACH4F6_38770 [Streptomyces sp. NPDC017936]|uniref:hypothetical protein n=1 Tax=Streptomyces sp. NPDC017936 TaxID=3365016 RepID=UPI0037BA7007